MLGGVLLFDAANRTKPIHYVFAGYFFFVGAFLDAARHDSPDEWGPKKWFLMAPVLPIWLVARDHHEMRGLWKPALAIALPFPALWLAGLGSDWLGERWLFFAEWVALIALVNQYLRDAMSHAVHQGGKAPDTRLA